MSFGFSPGEIVHDFKRTINKYEKAMGKSSQRGRAKSVPRKVQRAISAADGVNKFRQNLSAHVNLIHLTVIPEAVARGRAWRRLTAIL
ncbi:hypothetical protein TSTA_085280 [Talaromyces stipitatus ATCC 10500]|uniref:Uncharacterized protein n=1 Tax=Talaromyces stipitatus (strain ATCC 10500 / CBS 375.48 / QM 6759 / NRRL 1006) TaxID=441959 RepID=B8M0K0_TALSN|nr:uncharacterized protein TSTA_085280 [Talaromyces stipitatus ATCC 10500]EED21297.1 hypothetical protein TSTA_085280 [Talaromyces stipitatus ATCC 10500]